VWDPAAATWFYRGAGGAGGAALAPGETMRGMLIGWDPKAGKPAWIQPLARIMNGGVLATAGGLLVQGTADGFIDLREARTGALIRRIQTGTGISAAPITYRLDGVQYVAVAAGWNGVNPEPEPPGAPAPYDNAGRLIVLKLGGGPVPVAPRLPEPAPLMDHGPQPPALVARGQALYLANCGRCHGLAGERTPFPDLRRLSPETWAGFDDIVLRGAYKGGGMASFADVLSPADTAAIRAYLAAWAQGQVGAAGAGGQTAH
jgi:quinohemoprotein ethanol dehydrogenase